MFLKVFPNLLADPDVVHRGVPAQQPAGAHRAGDGVPPPLPRRLPQDAAVHAARRRAPTLRLPPLYRNHGECIHNIQDTCSFDICPFV